MPWTELRMISHIQTDSEDSSDAIEAEETDMFETTNSDEEESSGANRG